MANNDITVTILDNGEVKIETDAISGPIHTVAENMIKWIEQECGGEVTRTKRIDIHQNIHVHDHDHEHDHLHSHS